ncbi:G-protein coupled receptor [Metarhizium album ARSEF 1941]|uniref:G-protein coupled receptor n=1 Tax=Metarhizium album (strain ARSEF 1941) TaxID=1081103 RepID=A0A0B2WV60_METAS|nr:G-protein coupled receptor [Metarhizium album ARSEF 1941]KHN97529.1 G-protein coupled receptor [Metarhizium album ARSEF 1941]
MGQLTESQLVAISIMERACSAVSLLGCLFTIATFTCFRTFRAKPVNRLVFYASFGNMASNIGTLMSRAFLDDLESFGCQFQAMLAQWFMAADAGWILAMAINVYLTVYHKYDMKRLHRMELIYLPACYGIPFIPAFTYLFVRRNGKRVYGDAVLWCWVAADFEGLRIATFYGPIWAMILVTFSIYIATARTIFKIRKQVHDLSSDYDLASCTSAELPTVNVTRATTPRRGFGSQQGFSRRRSYEHKNAAWSYTKCALLYFTVILVTWIPASANRVYSLAHDGHASVPVAFMSAFVLPLQGFWNWIIYVFMSWTACKTLMQDIKAKFSPVRKIPWPVKKVPSNRSRPDTGPGTC